LDTLLHSPLTWGSRRLLIPGVAQWPTMSRHSSISEPALPVLSRTYETARAQEVTYAHHVFLKVLSCKLTSSDSMPLVDPKS
jgi:hypothetical protein